MQKVSYIFSYICCLLRQRLIIILIFRKKFRRGPNYCSDFFFFLFCLSFSLCFSAFFVSVFLSQFCSVKFFSPFMFCLFSSIFLFCISLFLFLIHLLGSKVTTALGPEVIKRPAWTCTSRRPSAVEDAQENELFFSILRCVCLLLPVQ